MEIPRDHLLILEGQSPEIKLKIICQTRKPALFNIDFNYFQRGKGDRERERGEGEGKREKFNPDPEILYTGMEVHFSGTAVT